MQCTRVPRAREALLAVTLPFIRAEEAGRAIDTLTHASRLVEAKPEMGDATIAHVVPGALLLRVRACGRFVRTRMVACALCPWQL